MIDIVIVNWNAGSQLRDCIASVRAFGAGVVGQCIVVDNGSFDGSADFLDGAADVTLIRAGANLGFGRACNLGAAQGNGAHILFLNPDARLLAGSLPGAAGYLDDPAHFATGIVGAQLIRADGKVQRSCARFPTALRLVAHSFGLTALFKRLDFQMLEWPHDETRQVDQVIGAFFVVRRALFQRLGGFDERFFVYFEEVDLSRRAVNLGFHSIYLAETQAWHRGGGVSEQVKAHRLFYSLRSRLLYASKHFSRLGAISVALAALVVEPVSRAGLLIATRRAHELPDLAHAYRMLWGWLLTQAGGR